MAVVRVNSRTIARVLLVILALVLTYWTLSTMFGNMSLGTISIGHQDDVDVSIHDRNPDVQIQKVDIEDEVTDSSWFYITKATGKGGTRSGSSTSKRRKPNTQQFATTGNARRNHTLPPQPLEGQQWIYPDHYPALYKYFAVAVKSGRDTALIRLPIQLLTFLKRLDKVVIIGESDGVWVGNIPVKDVYTGVYEDAERNIAKHNLTKRSIHENYYNVADQKAPYNTLDYRNNSSSIGPSWWGAVKSYHHHATTHLAEWWTAITKSLSADIIKHTGDNSRPLFSSSGQTSSTRGKRLNRRTKADEAVEQNTDTQGWKLDAHKNLPGFRYLFESYPDALWYFMIDDDTYLFIDNLVKLLEPYDPYKPHYFGAHNLFVGCDGVKTFEEGPPFAHGGTGIVVSRGAMIKLMKVLDHCIIKYKDCWAGDVRTGLCMRDAKVQLQGQPGFNTDPPNSRFGWPSAACSRPHTFHHVTVAQIQKLAHAEQEGLRNNPESVVTYADVFKEFSADLYNVEGIETDTNRPGSDFENFYSETAEICKDKCTANAKCMAWTWEGEQGLMCCSRLIFDLSISPPRLANRQMVLAQERHTVHCD